MRRYQRYRSGNPAHDAMRQIVLDTETTGLDPKQGHRIIELAARSSSSTGGPPAARIQFHLDPEREIDARAPPKCTA